MKGKETDAREREIAIEESREIKEVKKGSERDGMGRNMRGRKSGIGTHEGHGEVQKGNGGGSGRESRAVRREE